MGSGLSFSTNWHFISIGGCLPPTSRTTILQQRQKEEVREVEMKSVELFQSKSGSMTGLASGGRETQDKGTYGGRGNRGGNEV
jgi:hypothetical protein